jgi:hypothetical protein
LQDAGPGPSLLAKTTIPDPSYWSPDTPHIYDVTVELRNSEDVIASEVRQIGLKPLGVSGRFFTWEGKPWVLRGVRMLSPPEITIADWRAHSAVAVFPSDDQLTEASERGVICLCSTGYRGMSEEAALKEARRLARFPAVCFALPLEATDQVARFMPNVICCSRYLPGGSLSPGHKGFFLKAAHVVPDYLPSTLPDVPFIVYGLVERSWSLAEARAACDKLQANLAPVHQFAGYIVCPSYD